MFEAILASLVHDPAAAITAAATAVIAAFTVVLVCVTGRQARLTHEAVALGNRQFVSTNRPKMRIRDVETIPMAAGARHKATVAVANIGATEARIVAIGADIFVRGVEHDVSPAPYVQVVRPGSEARIDILGRQPLTPTQLSQIGHRSLDLRLLGIIRYEDANGTARNTSFFRIFDPTFNRFTRAPETDVFFERDYED